MRDGYFGAGSVARRVMSQRAVNLTYGQRALVVGATHPRLFQGTAQSTTERTRPYARLALTARLFETVFLGTRAEADRALAFTAKRHASVRGSIEEAAGVRHPAGAPYSASDPELMWWTAAFTLDSVETMHDLLVHRLRDAEREDLFRDFVRWAELFGMPAGAAPASYAEFRAHVDAYLASDEPFLTAEARQVGRYLVGLDAPSAVPLAGRPAIHVLNRVLVGSLPGGVRKLYGMPWSIADRLGVDAATRGSRVVHRVVPTALGSPVLQGPGRRFYRVPVAAERATMRRGRPSMPGVSDRDVASPG